ncbi:hypothetical protein ACH5RR_003368 [Cinchona calisaya]|uniref:Uncharacterized protein n=1 Tax=Cinchona calisaya TaxID=153742 RepID=A0ABD3AUK3_9GENT
MAHQHHNLTAIPIDAADKAVDIVAARELAVNIIAAQEVAIKTTTAREFSNDNAAVFESVIYAGTAPNHVVAQKAMVGTVVTIKSVDGDVTALELANGVAAAHEFDGNNAAAHELVDAILLGHASTACGFSKVLSTSTQSYFTAAGIREQDTAAACVDGAHATVEWTAAPVMKITEISDISATILGRKNATPSHTTATRNGIVIAVRGFTTSNPRLAFVEWSSLQHFWFNSVRLIDMLDVGT